MAEQYVLVYWLTDKTRSTLLLSVLVHMIKSFLRSENEPNLDIGTKFKVKWPGSKKVQEGVIKMFSKSKQFLDKASIAEDGDLGSIPSTSKTSRSKRSKEEIAQEKLTRNTVHESAVAAERALPSVPCSSAPVQAECSCPGCPQVSFKKAMRMLEFGKSVCKDALHTMEEAIKAMKALEPEPSPPASTLKGKNQFVFPKVWSWQTQDKNKVQILVGGRATGVYINKDFLELQTALYRQNPSKLLSNMLTELFGYEGLSKLNYTTMPATAKNAVIGYVSEQKDKETPLANIPKKITDHCLYALHKLTKPNGQGGKKATTDSGFSSTNDSESEPTNKKQRLGQLKENSSLALPPDNQKATTSQPQPHQPNAQNITCIYYASSEEEEEENPSETGPEPTRTTNDLGSLLSQAMAVADNAVTKQALESLLTLTSQQ